MSRPCTGLSTASGEALRVGSPSSEEQFAPAQYLRFVILSLEFPRLAGTDAPEAVREKPSLQDCLVVPERAC